MAPPYIPPFYLVHTVISDSQLPFWRTYKHIYNLFTTFDSTDRLRPSRHQYQPFSCPSWWAHIFTQDLFCKTQWRSVVSFYVIIFLFQTKVLHPWLIIVANFYAGNGGTARLYFCIFGHYHSSPWHCQWGSQISTAPRDFLTLVVGAHFNSLFTWK